LPFGATASRAVEATTVQPFKPDMDTDREKSNAEKIFSRTETGPPLSSENFQNQKRASLQAWANSQTR
jgi:hypothetical protein